MKKKHFLLSIVMLSTLSIYAQRSSDIEGGKDHPKISRFKGSFIEFYNETKWGSYKLPVNEKGSLDWGNPLVLEGKITRIQYTVSKENTSEFVLHNYKSSFRQAGYNILIAIANEELMVSERPHTWNDMYYVGGGYYNGLNNGRFGLGLHFPTWKNNHSFIAAKTHENNSDIYIIVYTVVDDNYTLITQDIIEVETIETGLVSVENLSNDINSKGHMAVYGIYFETGKSVITPESIPCFNKLAAYINANVNKRFYIVGHTDNVGNFSLNMSLSEERAKAVVSELTNKFNVNPEQLKAYGVSSLAPVSSNTTEEGRAKNRRVEIVEQ